MEALVTAAANAVFGIHLLFVLAMGPSTALFVLGRYRTYPLLAQAHCTAILVMAVTQRTLNACPLVVLERWLREAGGSDPWYHGSFSVFVVEHLTGSRLPVEVVFSLSAAVVALTGAAALAAVLRAVRGGSGPSSRSAESSG